jgi:hypothetical protein
LFFSFFLPSCPIYLFLSLTHSPSDLVQRGKHNINTKVKRKTVLLSSTRLPPIGVSIDCIIIQLPNTPQGLEPVLELGRRKERKSTSHSSILYPFSSSIPSNNPFSHFTLFHCPDWTPIDRHTVQKKDSHADTKRVLGSHSAR